MAKSFATMGNPKEKSSWKLSLALWPMAIIRGLFSSWWKWYCVSNRTSPPRHSISFRIEETIPIKASVPTWGLLSYKISSFAPFSTKVSRTKRERPSLSFTSVFNFPSEKVPAPPSPNCALEFGFKMPSVHNFSTVFIRFSTASPLS